MRVRIYTLAKELGVSSRVVMDCLEKLGVEIKSHSSSVDEETVTKLKTELGAAGKKTAVKAAPKAPAKKPAPKAPAKKPARKSPSAKKTTKAQAPPPSPATRAKKEEAPPPPLEKLTVTLPVNAKALAETLGVGPEEILATLIKSGVMASINQNLDAETVEILGHEYGRELEVVAEPPVPEVAVEEDEGERLPRAPVVTLMGHIDHGKTSLLDSVRQTRVVEREAGGITQHIGAYEVELEKGTITFLDTPGHETFTAMRARGANVTDIAILVVAADDGIMPQTREAIDHARAANVPIIVAINKIDKNGVSPDRVKQQLMEVELTPEDYGGETICCNVSAITKEGIEHLLEMIALQAEVLELKATREGFARAVVIEANMDKARGAVATVLVKKGTLCKGAPVVCGLYAGKIKALFNYRGEKVSEAGPAKPVEVLGLNGVPEPGDEIVVVKSEKVAKKIAEQRKFALEEPDAVVEGKMTLEDLYGKIAAGKAKELKLIIKGDTQGSIEALRDSLKNIPGDKVSVNIIRYAVGDINENDVMLASASDAVILGFHARMDLKAKELSRRERVEIKLYNVIYEAIEDVRKAMEGLLDPLIQETVLGRAEVKQTFKAPKGERVAGCLVTDGKVVENTKVRVIRGDKIVLETALTSLRRFKDQVSEVSAGTECGMRFGGSKDIKEGDIIEVFTTEKVPQKL